MNDSFFVNLPEYLCHLDSDSQEVEDGMDSLLGGSRKLDCTRVFEYDGKTYKVFQAGGVKIGVFALAGSDFERLVRPNLRPYAGAMFADRVATARQVVAAHKAYDQTQREMNRGGYGVGW